MPQSLKRRRRQVECFTIGWICALSIELKAARDVLDEEYEPIEELRHFILGRIGNHNVVVACMPAGRIGTGPAAAIASEMVLRFPLLRSGLVVGIAGGVPSSGADIRLGDVIISHPRDCHPGVVQYDFGKTGSGGEQSPTGCLNGPHAALLTAVSVMKSRNATLKVQAQILSNGKSEFIHRPSFPDDLYDASYNHLGGETCSQCLKQKILNRIPRTTDDIIVHYGLVGSGNQVMKDGVTRDSLSKKFGGIVCFEMEAAGVMNILPCLVVRGICDYCDSHKNKAWQPFAAAAAASCARYILSFAPSPHANHFNTDSLRPVDEDGTHSSLVPDGETSASGRKIQYLESLTFEQMDSRRATITNALENTCQWLLENPDFVDWQAGVSYWKHHGLFWIRGKPASGKSTIMKFVLRYIEKNSSHSVLSFFFNARGGELEKTTIGMYRSLLHQLLQTFPHLQDVFSLRAPISEQDSYLWDMETLKTLFGNAIERLGENTLICMIDALDECHEDQIREMVSFFEYLGTLSSQLRICFSSRHYPHITIQHGIELVLDTQGGHRDDISKYVHKELDVLGSSNLANQIRTDICRRSSDIFLWVILVIKILKKDNDDGRLHVMDKRLEQIPDGLNELFDGMLMRDNDNTEDLLLCIQWLFFARQPPKPEELYHAILIGIEPDSVRPRDSAIDQSAIHRFILSCSKGLVEITKSKVKRVQFIHESIRDYLLKEGGLQRLQSSIAHNIPGSSHDRLKTCCQDYLRVAQRQSREVSKYLSRRADMPTKISYKFPFLKYAVQNLLFHADNAEENHVSQQEFVQNFSPGCWVAVWNAFEKDPDRHYGTAVTPLYIFANEKASWLVTVESKRRQHVHFENERYGHPLIAALVNSDPKTVQALLEAKWSTNNETTHGEISPWTRNSALQKILDAEVFGLEKRSVFPWAMKKNKVHILEQILDLNIGFVLKNNVPDVLCWAAARRHVKMMNMIYDTQKLDSMSRGSDVRALYIAAEKGYQEVVQLLLSRGADANAHEGRYGYALQAASFGGHQKVVKMLLERGAVVNAQGGSDYDNALQAASAEGHAKVVEILLIHRADINSPGGYYGTPLAAAAWRGHKQVVKLLLEQGADVNGKGGHYDNALQCASAAGHVGLVELLLGNEADVNAQGGYYGNALQAASAEGYGGIVEVLLKQGAKVNAQGGRYDSALQAAVSSEEWRSNMTQKSKDMIVKLLQKHEAPLEKEEEVGRLRGKRKKKEKQRRRRRRSERSLALTEKASII